MFQLYQCIHERHDLRLLLIAAAICLLSTMTAVLLLRQARISQGRMRRQWAMVAGGATGFGIWATHFVAMLGYEPGFAVGYLPLLTMASLLLVVMGTTGGFVLALGARRRLHLLGAGGIVALGIVSMHYVGTVALAMPAILRWRADYVVASVVLGGVPLYPALSLILTRRSAGSGVGAGLLMSLAILLLHFTGMTGIVLVPSRMIHPGVILSPGAMSVGIGIVACGLLMLCVTILAINRRTRIAVQASERRLSFVIRGFADCAIYMLDHAGRVADWNAGGERLKGYDATEVIGMPFSRFYSAQDQAADMPQQALEIARLTGKFTGEGWRVRKDGSMFWAHVTIEHVLDEAGALTGYAKITRDMTQLKENQDHIAEASRRLDAALAHMHQGLCLFDGQGLLLLSNARFAELWNLPAQGCPAGTPLDTVIAAAIGGRTGTAPAPEQVEAFRKALDRTLRDPTGLPYLYEQGDAFVVSITSRSLPDGGRVITFTDITAQSRSEAKVAHMALHDDLTGLPNRARFGHQLSAYLEQASHGRQRLAVVVIDLNRFKEINDTFGHAEGDHVLQSVAARFRVGIQDGECIARLGGDEFAALKLYEQEGELAAFLRRLQGCFAEPVTHDSNSFMIGASLGVAVYPGDGDTGQGLINNADLAMYRAKASMNETLCFYERGMDETARARRQLANDLRHAIPHNELTLLYQPQLSLKTGAISGYEALLRWHHPRLGWVGPDRFIPLAEETGEILRIGEWVLREACQEAAKWSENHKVAVNLSAVQFQQADLFEVVMRALLDTGLAPARLELEITETAIISDKARALHHLRRIKALGVSVAIDDFGTGYSSLDTLNAFPFDRIKIDKTFLAEADSSKQARAIIRAVLALGQSLDIPVLAEGVETDAQLAVLHMEGCEEAQGYLFGRPAMAPSLSRGSQAVQSHNLAG